MFLARPMHAQEETWFCCLHHQISHWRATLACESQQTSIVAHDQFNACATAKLLNATFTEAITNQS